MFFVLKFLNNIFLRNVIKKIKTLCDKYIFSLDIVKNSTIKTNNAG